ncbi:hypothetical protein ACLOJK_003887 [Asimina triloba]
MAARKNQDRLSDQTKCLVLAKNVCSRAVEKLSDHRKHQREEERSRAILLMERQLNATWGLHEIIKEELSQIKVQYYRTLVPSRLTDVAKVLMPEWKSPMEKAAVGWVGDWRPSAILGLVLSLTHSGFLWLNPRKEHMLLELLRICRNEEAVLDEEMASYQATCILQLQFGRPTPPFCSSSGSKLENKRKYKKKIASSFEQLASVHTVLEKINGIIIRMQHLRYKAVEVVVQKLLDQTQAAKFFLAFAGIQDMVHEQTTNQRLRKGHVRVIMEAFSP